MPGCLWAEQTLATFHERADFDGTLYLVQVGFLLDSPNSWWRGKGFPLRNFYFPLWRKNEMHNSAGSTISKFTIQATRIPTQLLGYWSSSKTTSSGPIWQMRPKAEDSSCQQNGEAVFVYIWNEGNFVATFPSNTKTGDWDFFSLPISIYRNREKQLGTTLLLALIFAFSPVVLVRFYNLTLLILLTRIHVS